MEILNKGLVGDIVDVRVGATHLSCGDVHLLSGGCQFTDTNDRDIYGLLVNLHLSMNTG